MLHNTSSIKVVHISKGLELFIHLLDNLDESSALSPCVPNLTKAIPERNHDNLSVWPYFMNIIEQLDIATVVAFACNIVISVIVVGA